MKAQPPRRFYALNRDQASRDARPRAGATIQRHRRGAEHVNVLRGPPRSPPAGLINVKKRAATVGRWPMVGVCG
jgi:hypothetical protein